MFKKLILLSLLALHFKANACDVCGCSASNISGGFNGLQSGHLIGLSYSSIQYQSQHPILFESETPLVSTEVFQSLTLNGRFQIHKNIQLSGSLPYHFLARTENKTTELSQGLGDAQLLGHYVVSSKDSAKVKFRFLIGGGIKAPTGNSSIISDDYQIVIPNMQPGTGSWDRIVSALAFIQHNRFGISSTGIYQANTANKLDYKYGNKWFAQGELTYSLKLGNWKFRPQIGASYLHARVDYDDVKIGSTNEYSGGYFLNGSTSIFAFYGNWNLYVNAQIPVSQSFALNSVQAFSRFQFGLNHFIPKTK